MDSMNEQNESDEQYALCEVGHTSSIGETLRGKHSSRVTKECNHNIVMLVNWAIKSVLVVSFKFYD